MATNDQVIKELTKLSGSVGRLWDADDPGSITSVYNELKSINEHLSLLNGQVQTNTLFRKIGTWISCAIVIGLISIAVKLLNS